MQNLFTYCHIRIKAIFGFTLAKKYVTLLSKGNKDRNMV